MDILKNSTNLLSSLGHLGVHRATSIQTFDFSTLYTSIPHDLLKSRMNNTINNAFKEVPLLAVLTRNIFSNIFPWVLVNMWVQFLKRTACYRPLKNRHFVGFCTEKMMDRQYRESDARKIYSNYNQMRAMLNALQINQRNYTLSTFPSSNRRTLMIPE